LHGDKEIKGGGEIVGIGAREVATKLQNCAGSPNASLYKEKGGEKSFCGGGEAGKR